MSASNEPCAEPSTGQFFFAVLIGTMSGVTFQAVWSLIAFPESFFWVILTGMFSILGGFVLLTISFKAVELICEWSDIQSPKLKIIIASTLPVVLCWVTLYSSTVQNFLNGARPRPSGWEWFWANFHAPILLGLFIFVGALVGALNLFWPKRHPGT